MRTLNCLLASRAIIGTIPYTRQSVVRSTRWHPVTPHLGRFKLAPLRELKYLLLWRHWFILTSLIYSDVTNSYSSCFLNKYWIVTKSLVNKQCWSKFLVWLLSHDAYTVEVLPWGFLNGIVQDNDIKRLMLLEIGIVDNYTCITYLTPIRRSIYFSQQQSIPFQIFVCLFVCFKCVCYELVASHLRGQWNLLSIP